MCLLHALLELGGLELSVLHVDHGLRGEESRGDAAFVRELAARLGLPFCLREVTLGAGNVEQEGRRARLGFFHEQIAGGKVDRVALGHTRNDQAETVLFRFLRGSGTAGLSGIRPVTAEGLVRPLIEVERSGGRRFPAGAADFVEGRFDERGRRFRAQPDPARAAAPTGGGVESGDGGDFGAYGRGRSGGRGVLE